MTTVDIRDGLSVTISPLTTLEAMKADQLIGNILGDSPTPGAMALLTSKVYSLSSVRSTIKNGTALPVNPLAGGVEFESLCELFSLQELLKLQTAYSDLEDVGPEALKNSQGAEASAT